MPKKGCLRLRKIYSDSRGVAGAVKITAVVVVIVILVAIIIYQNIAAKRDSEKDSDSTINQQTQTVMKHNEE